MACESISRGRKWQCMKTFNGLKAVSFLNFTQLTLGADDKFAGLGLAGQELFRFELNQPENLYEEETVADESTMTAVTTGTLTLVLPFLDTETRNEAKKLINGRPQIFLEHKSGEIYLIGFENGATLTNFKMSTGGAASDMAGFNMSFKTIERMPYITLNSAGITAYQDAINITDVITPGAGLPLGS